jgi:hypothetical protein
VEFAGAPHDGVDFGLARAPIHPEEVILRQNIATLTRSSLSLMPEGLESPHRPAG